MTRLGLSALTESGKLWRASGGGMEKKGGILNLHRERLGEIWNERGGNHLMTLPVWTGTPSKEVRREGGEK